jgi:hypothetical protein
MNLGSNQRMKKESGDTAHLDERTIELFVIGSELLKDGRAAVGEHLSRCAGCAALHREISDYYAEVAGLAEEQAKKATLALYAPDRGIRPWAQGDHRLAVSEKSRLPSRFVQSVRRFPIRWASAFVAVAAALVFLLPQFFPHDRNPSYARAKDEYLLVYNEQGEELWRKHIGKGYDQGALPAWISAHPEEALTAFDVDGDGKNEVLAVFGWTSLRMVNPPLDNRILCFNADGTERWRYEVHRNISIGGVQYADDYRIQLMLLGDYNRDGNPEVVLGVTQNPWFPSAMIRLNAIDGSFVSEYWHPGSIPYFVHKDINGDGVEELFFAGQNNRLGRACLVVLDPRTIEGYAPAPKKYIPQGIPEGKEEYYLIFPPTDLEREWVDITNQVMRLTIKADGLLEVVVMEPLDRFRAEIYYYFDSSMKCVSVRGSDHFTAAHRQLEKEGKLKERLNDAYYERLRRGVSYWNGNRFVNHPTMTNLYREVTRKW